MFSILRDQAHMAAAFRYWGKQGYGEGISGHITVKDPVLPDHYWMNPFGVHFSSITVCLCLYLSVVRSQADELTFSLFLFPPVSAVGLPRNRIGTTLFSWFSKISQTRTEIEARPRRPRRLRDETWRTAAYQHRRLLHSWVFFLVYF